MQGTSLKGEPAERKVDDKQFQANCDYIAGLFTDLQASMISEYEKKLEELHGSSFLQMFDKFWSSIRLYTRWNQTIFNSVEKYLKLHRGETLLKITLDRLRLIIRKFSAKLGHELLSELYKDRAGDVCDARMVANLFKSYFEVDFEDQSKIDRVGSDFIYVYDEESGIKKSTSDSMAIRKTLKTTTFDKLLKEQMVSQTQDFYAKKVQDWLGLTVPDFLMTAKQYLNKEEQRADTYPRADQVLPLRQERHLENRHRADHLENSLPDHLEQRLGPAPPADRKKRPLRRHPLRAARHGRLR